MKNILKVLLVTSALVGSLTAFASVRDLSYEGYTGKYCVGDTLSYDVGGEYVERILISAQGIRRDGFIKVYADGELIHNVGVPGYDPDYSFRVRQRVDNISLKFERTCSEILDMKLFIADDNNESVWYQRYSWNGSSHNWGWQLLDIVNSLSEAMVFRADFQEDLWPNVLKPLKKLALTQGANEDVRDSRSLETAYYSLKIAQKIIQEKPFLYELAESKVYLPLVMDLFRMVEDILESYDVKKRSLACKIAELENYEQGYECKN